MTALLLLLVILLKSCQSVSSFSSAQPARYQTHGSTILLKRTTAKLFSTNNANIPSQEEENDFDNDDDNNENAEAWEELLIRVERMRLEEENKRRFLKSMPKKLPYEECRRWAQAQNQWSSKEEWVEWQLRGEGLSAYIPSNPEEYYGHFGHWISWEHFLGQ